MSTNDSMNGVHDSCDLIEASRAYVEKYMSQFDASHDYAHIKRVLQLAQALQASEQQLHPGTKYDSTLITLGALLHDVGDKKYLQPGQDASTAVCQVLLSAGAPQDLASRVQELVLHVSFTTEKKDPQKVQSLLRELPELAIVQDADRLDAIGAVGIGRCFAFTGAKGERGLDDSVQHFEDKLVKLEGMMKTETGKKLARERTERLRTFMGWWKEEVEI